MHFLILAVCIVVSLGAAFAICPIGMIESIVPGKCFRLIMRKQNNTRAPEICSDFGGSLASIETQAENDFVVRNVAGGAGESVLIGGAKTAANTWYWLDGTQMNYTNWATAEPYMEVTRDSLLLYTNINSTDTGMYGKWQASEGLVNAATQYLFICQLRINPTSDAGGANPARSCACVANCR